LHAIFLLKLEIKIVLNNINLENRSGPSFTWARLHCGSCGSKRYATEWITQLCPLSYNFENRGPCRAPYCISLNGDIR